MMGATNPLDSAPGTIRGDYALVLSENIVHGSDSPESAARELPLYFASGELLPAGGMTLVLASRSPQRRAILTQLGARVPRRRAAPTTSCRCPSPPHELAERAQPRQGALGRGGCGRDGARRRHARRGRRAGARQAGGRRRGRAHAGTLLAARTHEVVSGLTLRDRCRRAHGARPNGCALPPARRHGDRASTSRGANGAVVPVATPSRRPVRHSCRTSTDASSTSSACPVALLVEMLGERRRPVSG